MTNLEVDLVLDSSINELILYTSGGTVSIDEVSRFVFIWNLFNNSL